jgi:hypothetical protein
MSHVVLPVKTCSYWSYTAALMVEGLTMLGVGYRMPMLAAVWRNAAEFLDLAANPQPNMDSMIARSAAVDAIRDLLGTKLSQEDVDRILDECKKLFTFLQEGGMLTDRQLSTKQILRHIFKYTCERGDAENYARVVGGVTF